LIGLLVSLLLVGAVLAARRRALLQTTTFSYTPLSGEAEWKGGWEFSELGADPSEAGSQNGADRVTIPFSSTDLALRVRRGQYRAYFWVSVDGEPANRLPQEERGAYLVLTSPDYTPQVVAIPVASGLDDGPHVAEIIADRGWDQWPLVGWDVSRGPDTTAYGWALAGLAVVALACLGGAVWWGMERGRQGDKEARRQGEGEAVFERRVASYNLCSPISVLIAAGVFYFSPWLSLTLISGLALAVLILLRLDLGLALVALTAPFYMHPRPLLGKAFSMAEIATLMCALSWGVRQITKRKSQITNLTSLDLAALFFVLASVASTFAAEYRHVAVRELRVVVLEPAFFYLMLRTSRLDEKTVWRIVDGFVLGAVAVALIGLAQRALGINLITAEQGFQRLRSVYGSPNNAALYMGRALPVLAAVVLFGAARRRRVAYGAAVVPLGLAALLSFSRGAILLGVPFSLLALGVLAGGRWLWGALGAAAAAAVAAIPLLRTPRFAALLDSRSGATFFRLQLWRSSWTMFRDHPWLGVGPDNFLYQYRGRYILPAAWQEPDLSHPHNIFLDCGCRLGLGGLVAGLWLQAAFWRQALPLRRLADPDRRALALGLMGSMINFLAHGLVDASYFLIDLAFVFFLTLGIIEWLAVNDDCSYTAS
jgi:O-antigen ligase